MYTCAFTFSVFFIDINCSKMVVASGPSDTHNPSNRIPIVSM